MGEPGTVAAARAGRLVAMAVLLAGGSAWAHDPIFGLGPHTLFKDGVEIHVGYFREKAGDEREQKYGLALKYGITADWTVGIEAPYLDLTEPGASVSGRGDVALTTKYRFWRNDLPGAQEAAAVSLGVILGGTGDEDVAHDESTDAILGLSYGYEGRKWYRWAAVRYRANGEDDQGLRRGNKLLLDLVGGIRPRPYGYYEPDWVWMLELNGEFTDHAERNGQRLADTGGDQWFLSPGLMWTYRNYAIKTGVQLPIAQDLNGIQEEVDYRFTLEFEGHF